MEPSLRVRKDGEVFEKSLSLQERRRGRKNSFFNVKEGRDDFRKQVIDQ